MAFSRQLFILPLLLILLTSGWGWALDSRQSAQMQAVHPATPVASAMETDPKGWVDLLEDTSLAHWKRIPVGKPRKNIQQWSLDRDAGILRCSGAGDHENFQYDHDFSDGVFHCEWRFVPVPDGKGYNSGVYCRNSPDGAVWHQAQVGVGNIGYLFGETPVDGKNARFRADDHVVQMGNPPGEWNTYELTAKGKKLTLWINGAVTATFDACGLPKGQLGLEAEGWAIEFRNVKFKPAE